MHHRIGHEDIRLSMRTQGKDIDHSQSRHLPQRPSPFRHSTLGKDLEIEDQ